MYGVEGQWGAILSKRGEEVKCYLGEFLRRREIGRVDHIVHSN